MVLLCNGCKNTQPDEPSTIETSSPNIVTPIEVSEIKIPEFHSVEELFDFVETQNSHRRFSLIFASAENRFANNNLEDISASLRPYNSDFQFHFYDGVAHGRDWSSQTIKQQSNNIKSAIPPEYQERLFNGLAMYKISEAKGDMKKIKSLILNLEDQLIGVNLRDGVRVGFQRSIGHQPETALNKVSLFPEFYQSAIAEELGWRVGDDYFDKFVRSPWDISYDEKIKCKYRQGVARGRTMFNIENGNFADIIQDIEVLGDLCHQWKWIGMGVALKIQMMEFEEIENMYRAPLSIEKYELLKYGYAKHLLHHMSDIPLPELTDK